MITCFGQVFKFGRFSQCWLSHFTDDAMNATVYVATESYDNEGPSIARARQELWSKVAQEKHRADATRDLIFFEVFNAFSLPLRKHDGYQGIREIVLRDGRYVAIEVDDDWKQVMEKHVAEAVEGTIWHNLSRDKYMREFREDGKKVKAARRAMGLKQSEFSQRLGISMKTLGRIERGETETKHKIMAKVDEMLSQYRFTYSRLDKLADRDEMLGYELAERICDKCGKSAPARDSYCLTPIDFAPWLAESKSLDTWKAFGPNRCGECLPPDSLEGGAYLKARPAMH
jgi:transcriptional regulator with XRE-family HTH domain